MTSPCASPLADRPAGPCRTCRAPLAWVACTYSRFRPDWAETDPPPLSGYRRLMHAGTGETLAGGKGVPLHPARVNPLTALGLR